VWDRRRSGRLGAAALIGGAIFGFGMAVGGRGGTYAAYSDFVEFHNSVEAPAQGPALPPVPAACRGLAHAHVRYGTEDTDRLTAYPDARVLMGLGGDDTLLAATGRNCLVGGPGYDVCVGTLSVDIFVGCEEVVPSGSPAASTGEGPTAPATGP